METFTLLNGLKVHLAPDPSCDTVIAQIAFRVGSNCDGKNSGIAHFLEHLVLDGTTGFPSNLDLDNLVETLGAQKNGFTSKEDTRYFCEGNPKDLETFLLYLAQITRHALLREEDIVKEIGVISKEIKRKWDNPFGHSKAQLEKMLFPECSYGSPVLGTEESLANIAQDMLRYFMLKHYTASNAVLLIEGNFDPDIAVKLVKKFYSSWRSGSQVPISQARVIMESQQTWETRKGLAQSHVHVVYPGYSKTDPRHYALLIIGNILGGGMSSRLFLKLRKQNTLIYSLNGLMDITATYGYWGTGTGVDHESLPVVLAAIRDELDRLQEEMIAQEDIEKVQNRLLVQRAISSQRMEQRTSRKTKELLLMGDIISFSDYSSFVRGVTAEDALNAAQEIFSGPEQLFVLSPHEEEYLLR